MNGARSEANDLRRDRRRRCRRADRLQHHCRAHCRGRLIVGQPRSARAQVSCSQQYTTWIHRQGKGLVAALGTVSSAATAGDAHVLTVTLKRVRPTVARAARHPVPACAGPRGYWDVLLMHVNAAAAARHSPSTVRAAMEDVPVIQRQLTAELKQTVP